MTRNCGRGAWLGWSMLGLLAAGCMHTTHEIEVKPMHLTVDINVRVQNELKQEFRAQDEATRQISEAEAEAALAKYLLAQEQGE